MGCFPPLIMRSLWQKKRDIDIEDFQLPISNCQMSKLPVSNRQSEIGNRQSHVSRRRSSPGKATIQVTSSYI
jgi:hypothetical protein